MKPPDFIPSSSPPYGLINSLMNKGRVVVFLGAGASVAERGPQDRDIRQPRTAPRFDHLPSRDDVARYISAEAGLVDAPQPDQQSGPREGLDLALAAQFFEMEAGRTHVDHALKRAYADDYPPGELHTYLAGFPAHLLIVTTNYDQLLEQAFTEAGRPYALITYQRERPAFLFQEGRESAPRWVLPNEIALDLRNTTVIYKMHGTVSPGDAEPGGFVITEEDYVDFLARMGAKTAIPAVLAEAFRRSHFLFLGYRLRDWYSRVILQMLWREWPPRHRSWAVERVVTPLERKFYERYGLDLYPVGIGEFVAGLRESAG